MGLFLEPFWGPAQLPTHTWCWETPLLEEISTCRDKKQGCDFSTFGTEAERGQAPQNTVLIITELLDYRQVSMKGCVGGVAKELAF